MSSERFLNDPKGFIRKNLLMLEQSLYKPSPAVVDQATGTVWVKLVQNKDYTHTRTRNRKGFGKLMAKFGAKTEREAHVDTFFVTSAVSGEAGAFRAYILPFEIGGSQPIMLEQHASYMFTARMDGCTFAAGMPNPMGGRRVVHVNDQQAAANLPPSATIDQMAAAQSKAQATRANFAIGAKNIKLEPARYRANGDEASTLLGIRTGNRWEFYHQDHTVGDRFIGVTKMDG